MNSGDETITDPTLHLKVNQFTPQLYDESIEDRVKIKIIKDKISQSDESFEFYYSHISFLRRMIGDQDIHEEVVNGILEEKMVDLILSFMSEENMVVLPEGEINSMTSEIVLIVNGLLASEDNENINTIL